MVHFRCQVLEPGRRDATVVDIWAESTQEATERLNAQGLVVHSVTRVEETQGPQPDWRSAEYSSAMRRIVTRSLIRVLGLMSLAGFAFAGLFRSLAAAVAAPIAVWIACEIYWFLGSATKDPRSGA